jgi:hypothetical protein
MKQIFSLILISVFLFGCAASVNSTFTSQEKSLTTNDKVAFLDIKHKVPENAKKLGEAKYGDSGFSTDCDFNSNLIKARQLARQNGANIVKIVESKSPDILSSCYRMKLEFYFFSGDVTQIEQYQLHIN